MCYSFVRLRFCHQKLVLLSVFDLGIKALYSQLNVNKYSKIIDSCISNTDTAFVAMLYFNNTYGSPAGTHLDTTVIRQQMTSNTDLTDNWKQLLLLTLCWSEFMLSTKFGFVCSVLRFQNQLSFLIVLKTNGIVLPPKYICFCNLLCMVHSYRVEAGLSIIKGFSILRTLIN